jgi:hypothetical protein
MLLCRLRRITQVNELGKPEGGRERVPPKTERCGGPRPQSSLGSSVPNGIDIKGGEENPAGRRVLACLTKGRHSVRAGNMWQLTTLR